MPGALTYRSSLLHAVPLLDADSYAERRQFIFVGRPVHEKGYDVLLAGYEQYHAEAADPWALVIVGDAPVRPAAPERYLGFVDHERLAAEMARSTCLILPSRFEPYGAVVLEAAAAGLVLLVSGAVGAQTDLLSEGVNGFVIPEVDSARVAEALHRVSALTPSELAAASVVSRRAAAAFTPVVWADSLERALRWAAPK